MVEQVDREAAAPFAMALERDQRLVISGRYDSLSIVQAFARHRTEATAALEERVKLLEAVARDAVLSMPVLITMCRAAGLEMGESAARQILTAAREALNDPKVTS